MSNARRSRHATRTEVIKIHAMLQEVLIADGEQCTYKDNHSDETVAAATGATAGGVMGVRKELFGNLIVRKPNDGDKRVEDAIRLAENLLTLYQELKLKYNNLITTLSLNKVADVRHLEIK